MLKLEIPEKFFKYRRKVLSEKEFMETHNEVINGGIKGQIRATIGSYVLTVKTRTQDYRFINEAKSLEINGEKLAYSEVSKAILYTLARGGYFGRKKKSGIFFYRKKHLEILEESLPAIYCKAGQYRDMTYLDIKAFYWTIYTRFIDAEYERGSFLGVRYGLPQEYAYFLYENKPLRNTLFGIMRNRRLTEWYRGALRTRKVNNEYLNPQLCILTYDISQAIALYLIKNFKAVYYYVDGFIIPVKYENEAMEFLNSLGFRVERKVAGAIAEVKSAGCYAFYDSNGELVYETLNYKHRKGYKSTSNLYLSEEEAKFLLYRLEKLA